MEGWIVSSALVGCLIGAAIAGVLSDRFGRKKIMLLAAVLFVLCSVGSAVPTAPWHLVVARIVGGTGIGIASMLSPMYIAEIAPARLRGGAGFHLPVGDHDRHCHGVLFELRVGLPGAKRGDDVRHGVVAMDLRR